MGNAAREWRDLPRMTVADFIAWPGDGTTTRYELVDGELRAMAPASNIHGVLQGNLALVIGGHLRGTGSLCQVIVNGGVQPQIRKDMNFRIPNIVVECTRIAKGEYGASAPRVIIEVLSPGNQADTYENIRSYTTIPEARDLLVVHSTRVLIELWVRDGNRDWPAQPTLFETGDTLTIPSLTFSCPVDEIYSGTGLLDQ